VSYELRQLLQSIFFEAHVVQRRVIEDWQLDEAALARDAPDVLAGIRARTNPFSYKGRAEKGHYVEVVGGGGGHAGKRGVLTEDEKSRPMGVPEATPYKVTFDDGANSGWLKPAQLTSSGLNKATFEARSAERSATSKREMREAITKLPRAMQDALMEVRERVARDALPLLSLLQAEPLQVQSSHLSFQEYFAARALCEDGTVLSGAPPWQWPAWWANTVAIGTDMGVAFGRGLLHAAKVTGDTLDLSGKMGGDGPTVLRVLGAMLQGSTALTKCNVRGNNLDRESATSLAKVASAKRIMLFGITHDQTKANLKCQELRLVDAILIASDLRVSAALKTLDLRSNSFGKEGAIAMVEALKVNTALTSLDISSNFIGPELGVAMAEMLQVNTALTECNVRVNNLDCKSATALATVASEKRVMLFGIQHTQKVADFARQQLGLVDAILIASDLRVSTALTYLNLASSNLTYYGRDMTGVQAIAEALKFNTALTDLNLYDNGLDAEAGKSLADALKVNTALTTLNLSKNELCGLDMYGRGQDDASGITALAEALQVNTALKNLSIAWNNISGEVAQQLAAVVLARKSLEVLSEVPIKELRADQLTALELKSKGLGSTEAIVLAELLQGSTALTNLNLYDNYNSLERGEANVMAEGLGGGKAMAEMLKVNTAMNSIKLDRNPLPVKQLKGTEPVQTLDLSNKGLGPASGIVIAKLIEFNTALTSVNVLKNAIQMEAAKELVAVFWQHKTLKTLCGLKPDQTEADFRGQGLLPSHGILIAADLEFNTTMTSLTLVDNNLTYFGQDMTGVHAIAGALKVNTALTELNLRTNYLKAKAGKALADALKVNTALTSLDLSDNGELTGRFHHNPSISDDMSGVRAIAGALKVNAALTDLNLYGNHIGTEGAKAMAEALKFNTALTDLNLALNNLGAEGAKAIAEILKFNTALNKLDLRYNSMRDKDEQVLRDSVKGREGFELLV